MAQKGIREFDAKKMLARWLSDFADIQYEGKVALVSPETNLDQLPKKHAWLKNQKLVVKPDQLFGKRGKNNLLLLDADWNTAALWIGERMKKSVQVGKVKGELTHFLVEPFVPHDKEYYVAIRSKRDGDVIYFSETGGINIEENWDKVKEIKVAALEDAKVDFLVEKLNLKDPAETSQVVNFLTGLLSFFRKFHFAYLEINPFTIKDGKVVPLDTVAKLDDTAAFECAEYWDGLTFPAAFGKTETKEEKYISQLDEKSGSSMKLTVLNPDGRIWLMVAGGGASVIYADTVVDLGCMKDLANYGEYSGNPTKDETREYASTILDLMTRKKHPKGKVLLIGGGIANFTDVAKTFTGIIEVLTKYKDRLIDHNVRIYVRRGGPNYLEGLEKMKRLGKDLGVTIQVYGPETHMTKIVSLAIEDLEIERGDQ